MNAKDEPEKGMRMLCREIFGTENPDELREIARKARRYDRMTGAGREENERGAGRKERFSDEEVDFLIELYHQGETVQFLARRFDASRPTIYKYLLSEKRFEKDPSITMRMRYMYRDTPCTVIDVDFRHKRIYIRNITRRILWRAFGVLEEPTWEDFEDFLESRCFPISRANLKQVLRDLDLTDYDPIRIIEKTQGRMAEDHHWIRIQYRDEVLKRGTN